MKEVALANFMFTEDGDVSAILCRDCVDKYEVPSDQFTIKRRDAKKHPCGVALCPNQGLGFWDIPMADTLLMVRDGKGGYRGYGG